MLRTLDEKVETFLHVLRRKGDVVNTVVAVATAKALIARTLDEHLKCLDLDFLYWDMSLFRRMDFMKQTCTTSKPEISKLTKKRGQTDPSIHPTVFGNELRPNSAQVHAFC